MAIPTGTTKSTSTSETTWKPAEGARPAVAAGSFAAPEYSQQRVGNLAQRFQAPGIRKLRTEVRRAGGESYDNPNAKRMVMRDALQGYGQGLESVVSGAYKQALGQYNVEYGHAWNQAMTNFNASEAAKAANFETEIESWMKQGTATTTAASTSTSPLPGGSRAASGARKGVYATLPSMYVNALQSGDTSSLTSEQKEYFYENAEAWRSSQAMGTDQNYRVPSSYYGISNW